MSDERHVVTLYHKGSGREVPVEVVTVLGRNDHYYRYTDVDQRPDRLNTDVADGLAAHNYVQVSSDDQISRTHGLLDPAMPGVCDLNSTNGTSLNGSQLPRRQGREGPMVTLEHEDVITLGRQVFKVQVRKVTQSEVVNEAQTVRFGLVGGDAAHQGRVAQIQQFLSSRKGFQLRLAVDWPGVISSCYSLQQDATVAGLVVCSLACDVRGETLILDGKEMPFDKLITVIQGIPGRKVVALEVDGDPTACEVLFEAIAHEDMVLVTSPAQADLDRDDVFENTAGTFNLEGLRESVSGDSTPGTYDDVVDGLDALIQADSNILMISWIATYDGRVKISFGSREDADDRAISHSLRLGSTTFRF